MHPVIKMFFRATFAIFVLWSLTFNLVFVFNTNLGDVPWWRWIVLVPAIISFIIFIIPTAFPLLDMGQDNRSPIERFLDRQLSFYTYIFKYIWNGAKWCYKKLKNEI
jgi:hypothetical protein